MCVAVPVGRREAPSKHPWLTALQEPPWRLVPLAAAAALPLVLLAIAMGTPHGGSIALSAVLLTVPGLLALATHRATLLNGSAGEGRFHYLGHGAIAAAAALLAVVPGVAWLGAWLGAAVVLAQANTVAWHLRWLRGPKPGLPGLLPRLARLLALLLAGSGAAAMLGAGALLSALGLAAGVPALAIAAVAALPSGYRARPQVTAHA